MLAKPLAMTFTQNRNKQKYVDPDVARDLKLVQRIANGDEPALHELYALHGQRLYAYALRLTGDPTRAEDVLQDVLVVIWKSAKTFRGESRPTTWMLGIVHHTAIKSLRHNSVTMSEELETNLVDKGPSPEDQMRSQEKQNWVQRGLLQLSAEHRAVLELIFYHGLSLQEAAVVCDCPIGTVKSRLSYARRQLKGVLNRMEEER